MIDDNFHLIDPVSGNIVGISPKLAAQAKAAARLARYSTVSEIWIADAIAREVRQQHDDLDEFSKYLFTVGDVFHAGVAEGIRRERRRRRNTAELELLRTEGRRLCTEGKGAELQRLLSAHGVKLLGELPEADRAEVLAEMRAM